MYVCTYLCIYVTMYLCKYVSIYLRIYVSIYAHACMHGWMDEWMWMDGWMDGWACLHACMYVAAYNSMNTVCIYMCISHRAIRRECRNNMWKRLAWCDLFEQAGRCQCFDKHSKKLRPRLPCANSLVHNTSVSVSQTKQRTLIMIRSGNRFCKSLKRSTCARQGKTGMLPRVLLRRFDLDNMATRQVKQEPQSSSTFCNSIWLGLHVAWSVSDVP